MRKEGYISTERNVKVRVSDKAKPYECDIHGHCYSRMWDKLRQFGLYYYIFLCFVAYFAGSISPLLWILGISSLALGYVGKKKTGHHIWVECKNLNGKANRDHVMKLVYSVNLLKSYKQADWQPKRVLLVSASDFERDALRLAKEHQIYCYRKTDRGFEMLT